MKNVLINERSDSPSESPKDETWVPEWKRLMKLAMLGFFINCKPSEAYLTPYLRDVKGFSEHTLNASVWPFSTYGQLALTIPVGLAAEYFGYRTTIFVSLLAREATRVLLVFGDTLFEMQVVELVYSFSEAGKIIYYAYVYMVLDIRDFQLGTSVVYAVYHSGMLIGSLIAEAINSYVTKDLTLLFYISWGIVSCGFLAFAILPAPRRNAPISLPQMLYQDGVKATAKIVGRMFSDTYVLYWSFQWLLGYASLQVFLNYGDTQVYDINPDAHYGFYWVVLEALWMLGALLPNMFNVTFLRDNSPLVICLLCLIEGISCLLSTACRSVVSLILLHCIILTIASALQVTATAVIATQIAEPRYAAITSMLTFGALALTTIALQIGAAQDWKTSTYFYFIASLQAIIAAVFVTIFLGEFVRRVHHRHYHRDSHVLLDDNKSF